MPILDDLAKGAATGIIGGIANIVDQFHTSDEEKAAIKERATNQVIGVFDVLMAGINVEIEAKKAITVAELQQGDTYTKRARPTIVYAGLGFICTNYVIFPMLMKVITAINIFFMDTLDEKKYNALLQLCTPLADLPTEFWFAWGGVCGTWVVGRSLERSGVVNNVVKRITGNA